MPGAGRRSVVPGMASLTGDSGGVSVTYVPNPGTPRSILAPLGCGIGIILVFAIAALSSKDWRASEDLLIIAVAISSPFMIAWGVQRVLLVVGHQAAGRPVIRIREGASHSETCTLHGGMIEWIEVVPNGVRVYFEQSAPKRYRDRVALLTPQAPATVEDLVTLLESMGAADRQQFSTA